MNKKSAVNASPLIFLSRAGCLEFLHHFYQEVHIPEPVAEEICVRGDDDITVKSIKQISWLKIVKVDSISDIVLQWGLGKGESSVLSLAYTNPGMEIVIDDLLARKCASLLNIPVRGTLGIVLVLKKRGVIKEARPVIQNLLDNGMYLSPSLIDKSLKIVGE